MASSPVTIPSSVSERGVEEREEEVAVIVKQGKGWRVTRTAWKWAQQTPCFQQMCCHVVRDQASISSLLFSGFLGYWSFHVHY